MDRFLRIQVAGTDCFHKTFVYNDLPVTRGRRLHDPVNLRLWENWALTIVPPYALSEEAVALARIGMINLGKRVHDAALFFLVSELSAAGVAGRQV